MRKLLHWRSLAIGIGAGAIVGAAVRWLTGLPFWAAFGLVLVGMFINGVIAEIEDNRHGGFNNPG